MSARGPLRTGTAPVGYVRAGPESGTPVRMSEAGAKVDKQLTLRCGTSRCQWREPNATSEAAVKSL